MPLESYDLQCLRVKLFKKGYSHAEIDQIFRDVHSANELYYIKNYIPKIVNTLTDNNNEIYHLMQQILDAFVANRNLDEFSFRAFKKDNHWHFVLG